MNSLMDQAPLIPYRNYHILSWNEIPIPDFGYDHRYQDQFMFSQDNMALGDNFQNFGAAPNIIAYPAAVNVPNGPVAAIQGPAVAVQPVPHQHAHNMTLGNNFQNFGAAPNIMAHPAAADIPAGPVAAIQVPPAAIQPVSPQRAQCTICLKTLSRTSDLPRHMKSVHNIGTQVLHLCPVLGCPQSYGAGLSRKDKLLEHLRNVHRM
jgi:hypothetical protein